MKKTTNQCVGFKTCYNFITFIYKKKTLKNKIKTERIRNKFNKNKQNGKAKITRSCQDKQQLLVLRKMNLKKKSSNNCSQKDNKEL